MSLPFLDMHSIPYFTYDQESSRFVNQHDQMYVIGHNYKFIYGYTGDSIAVYNLLLHDFTNVC